MSNKIDFGAFFLLDFVLVVVSPVPSPVARFRRLVTGGGADEGAADDAAAVAGALEDVVTGAVTDDVAGVVDFDSIL